MGVLRPRAHTHTRPRRSSGQEHRLIPRGYSSTLGGRGQEIRPGSSSGYRRDPERDLNHSCLVVRLGRRDRAQVARPSDNRRGGKPARGRTRPSLPAVRRSDPPAPQARPTSPGLLGPRSAIRRTLRGVQTGGAVRSPWPVPLPPGTRLRDGGAEPLPRRLAPRAVRGVARPPQTRRPRGRCPVGRLLVRPTPGPHQVDRPAAGRNIYTSLRQGLRSKKVPGTSGRSSPTGSGEATTWPSPRPPPLGFLRRVPALGARQPADPATGSGSNMTSAVHRPRSPRGS